MKKVTKASHVAAALTTIGLLIAAGPLLAGDAKPVPQDGIGAKVMRFDNLNNYRYCEVFLIGGNQEDLQAAFYNTTDLNTQEDARDSCPDDLWDKLDKEALKKQYDLLGVFKNGPRFWMYDWIEIPVGKQKNLDGLQARWMGQVQLPKGFGKEGTTYYKPTTVHRASKQGYKKGQRVFILDDPNGIPWVLQAYSHIVDPNLKYEDLMTLDKKLKLAPDWKYRTKVLDKDLTIHAVNGVARIVQDDLEGTYNACFEEDGQKSCTFQP